MNPIPGELYLIDLGIVGKVRPAVVVSRQDPDAPRALAICAPLTTENRGSDYEVPLGKLTFLARESWVNVQGLTSLGHEKLRQTHRHPDPGERKPVMIELRVLGKRGVRWLKQQMKPQTGRLLGACPSGASSEKQKREPGVASCDAEVFKLHPTPTTLDSIAP